MHIDRGSENVLISFVQTLLAPLRQGQHRLPVTWTSSVHNTVVERVWVEVNMRVTGPLKMALLEMIFEEEVEINNPLHLYCISTITLKLANLRIQNMLTSFHWRRIQGSRGCVPDIARRYSN